MTTLVLSFLDGSSSFLQVTRLIIKARMSSELSAHERLKKSMNNVVTTLAPSFLIVSSFILADNKKTHEYLRWVRNSAGSDQELMSYMSLSVWKNPHRLIMGERL